ncbi:YjjG family noncanonical pyrimidine nucleotidase [Aliagarivorans taiwanensis]|uniref:YjjG family noncanonical pyrimidine nucleotidase n=1 Tax=Aliagarivorans taiwanensis TaxID=561966 RepID=UPI00040AAEB8|nr:YjjG family noncanonical pyrimidine nucleotidase [Aliagarivorans taiwanensis]
MKQCQSLLTPQAMPYQHLIFDLDHTLWDFDRNANRVLEQLTHEFLGPFGISFDQFMVHYTPLNAALWDDYHHHRVTKQQLRERRFPETVKALGLREEQLHQPSVQMEQLFIERCSDMDGVFPHCHKVLETLAKRYQLHIMTNGFAEAQHRKLRAAKLEQYFEQVFISEHIGANKPSPLIFEHALKALNCPPEQCIMIGDNLHADVGGAQASGIDQIWFNPTGLERGKDIQPTYQIACLSELPELLLC